MDVPSGERFDLPSELLYAEDVSLMAPTVEYVSERVADTIDGDGRDDLHAIARIRNVWMKYRVFVISDIQSTR